MLMDVQVLKDKQGCGRIKNKNIFNLWLQLDERVILSKTEGLSCFVYPSLSLSLFANDSTAKDNNKFFVDLKCYILVIQ